MLGLTSPVGRVRVFRDLLLPCVCRFDSGRSTLGSRIVHTFRLQAEAAASAVRGRNFSLSLLGEEWAFL